MAGWPPSSGVKRNPADAAERDKYAHLCYEKKRYVAAARFFSQDLIADPKSADDLERAIATGRVHGGPGRLRPGERRRSTG